VGEGVITRGQEPGLGAVPELQSLAGYLTVEDTLTRKQVQEAQQA